MGRSIRRRRMSSETGPGRRIKSVRTAWENARDTAGLARLQPHDIRHEEGSRFDQAGVSVNVSKIPGHTNLNTRHARYLTVHRPGLQERAAKSERKGLRLPGRRRKSAARLTSLLSSLKLRRTDCRDDLRLQLVGQPTVARHRGGTRDEVRLRACRRFRLR